MGGRRAVAGISLFPAGLLTDGPVGEIRRSEIKFPLPFVRGQCSTDLRVPSLATVGAPAKVVQSLTAGGRVCLLAREGRLLEGPQQLSLGELERGGLETASSGPWTKPERLANPK